MTEGAIIMGAIALAKAITVLTAPAPAGKTGKR